MKCGQSCQNIFCEVCHPKCRVEIRDYRGSPMPLFGYPSISVITHHFESGDGEGLYCSACIVAIRENVKRIAEEAEITAEEDRRTAEEEERIIKIMVDDNLKNMYNKEDANNFIAKVICVLITLSLLWYFFNNSSWLWLIATGIIGWYILEHLSENGRLSGRVNPETGTYEPYYYDDMRRKAVEERIRGERTREN